VTTEGAKKHHMRFMDAIDDDLDLPAAVKVLHEALSDEAVPPSERASLARTWDEILGLDLAPSTTLDQELEALIAEREDARRSRDFARADAIRDRLRNAGVELLDSSEGTTWVKR